MSASAAASHRAPSTISGSAMPGGVGSHAVQIAVALGARVTATAAARDAAFVGGLGARTVLDYAGPLGRGEVANAKPTGPPRLPRTR